MKTCVVLYAALFAAAAVHAQKSMSHDQVQPFAQPASGTLSDKAGVIFKPQIHVDNGCHSYPAVNAAGQPSGGLDITGPSDGKCKGSGYGSQIYGRSEWHGGKWAIMYAVYHPKDSPSHDLGHRHDWEHVIVWTDNPAATRRKILAVSVADGDKYSSKVPPEPKFVSGTSVKLSYGGRWPLTHKLRFTTKPGQFQPLIMWNQLSKEARHTLNTYRWTWGKEKMPLSDEMFRAGLTKAWPFGGHKK